MIICGFGKSLGVFLVFFTRFQKTNTQYDVDECKSSDICDRISSSCENTVGSYRCVCNKGFTAVSDGTCTDVDECMAPNACSWLPNSYCVNTVGSRICNCSTGYVFSRGALKCQDVDECKSSNICDRISSSCENTVGSYRCVCKTGFTAASDGTCTAIMTRSGQPKTSDTLQKVVMTTDTNKLDTLTRAEQPKPKGTLKKELTVSNIGLIISFVLNGVLVLIVIILAILLFRKRDFVKKTLQNNFKDKTGVRSSGGDKSDKNVSDIKVATSPAFQNSRSVGSEIPNSNGSDLEKSSSIYVSTPMYVDLDSTVNVDYVNMAAPQSRKDYEGLPVDQATEQVLYETL